MNKNDLIQIELDYNTLTKIIKKYYIDTYSVKTCNVKFEAENIKDRLKELDLFHHEDNYYNTIFKTVIDGKIEDKIGKVNNFREELDVEGTKELIKSALSSKYDYHAEDFSIVARYAKNNNGGFDVVITGANCLVDQKFLRKRL